MNTISQFIKHRPGASKHPREFLRLLVGSPLLARAFAQQREGAPPPNGEGLIAGRFALPHLCAMPAQINDPEKQKLLKHKEEVEHQIDEPKYRKASMALEENRRQLAGYLVDLANTQEALDK